LSGNLHAFSSAFRLLVIHMLSAGADNGLRMGMEVGGKPGHLHGE